MEKRILKITDESAYRIVMEPYRLKIMEEFESYGRPATVKEIADVIGDSAAKVSYHVKKMIGIDLFELDHTESINGITAKYYKLKYDDIEIKLSKSDSNVEDKISEYSKLLYSLLDNFKEKIKTELGNLEMLEDKNKCTMTSTNLFMTDEEAEIFEEEYKALIYKYKQNSEGKKRYELLLGKIKSTK